MITVFGSINLDIVIPVESLPRAGETVLGKNYLMIPGGKGANQACAAARTGAQTAIYGNVGDDGFAQEALKILEESGVDLSGVRTVESPTGCATIWVDEGGENSIVVAPGANMKAIESQVDDAALSSDHLLVLQMELPHRENWKLIERAKKNGARVLLNVAPAGLVPEEILEKIDFLLVNELEGHRVAHNVGLDEPVPSRLPRALAKRYGLTCILTLGGAGSLCFGPQGGWSVPALPITPTDSTAAGDAFIGTFAAQIDQGEAMDLALRRAAVAGGLSCTYQGSQNTMPTAAEIDAELDRLPPIRKLG